MNRRVGPAAFCVRLRATALHVTPSLCLLAAACGGGSAPPPQATQTAVDNRPRLPGDAGIDDRSRCEFRGRIDREVVETAGPGALQPNVRRVYQMVGSGDSLHKVIMCREIDTNLDGIKDIVRTYNEKGESLHEEADTNYDGRIDTWISFSGGRIVKEELDTDFDGNPDVSKFYTGGQLTRIQRDTNHDGRPDRWEFYTAGKLERMGVDLDGDGHVDRWDHDEQARALAEEQAATAERNAKAAAAADAGVGAAADAGTDAARPKRRR